MRELSAFLPAHDEAGCIADTVARTIAAIDGLDLARFEVIVVDDGSTDGTGAIADALAAADDRVRTVHHQVNRGYGAALKTGLEAARYEWVFWTDGDGQFDLEEIDRLVAFADTRDVVVGYRVDRQDHLGRKLNTLLWTLVVRAVLGLQVRDVDCAFKLLRRRCLDEIGPLQADGAVLSAELLVRLDRAGMKLEEVPVSHLPRRAGEASGASPRVIARALRELWRLRRSL